MPSREGLAAYQATTKALAEKAGATIKQAVTAYMRENPSASVAEVRNFTIEAAKGAITEFSQASAVAAEYAYAAEVGSSPDGYFGLQSDDDGLEDAVRYQACNLVEGDTDAYLEGVARYVSQQSFNACNKRTLALARGKKSESQKAKERRSKKKAEHRVWFARVPSGVDTCKWCAGLAARGYTYWTAETAGKFSKWHENCRCTVVASIKKGGIEGYDPQSWTYLSQVYDWLDSSNLPVVQRQNIKNLLSMYDIEDFREASGVNGLIERYASCAESTGLDILATAKADAERIYEEASSRDLAWLLKGDKCPVSSEPGAKPLKKESAVADFLAENGFQVEFIKEINRTGVKTADARLNGEVWEFKIPGGWSKADERSLVGEHTVRKQFYKAVGKQTKKLLLSNDYCRGTFEELLAAAEKTLESGDYPFDEVIVVSSNTAEIRHLKK